MIQTWFVRRDGEEIGPFDADEIRERAANGWLRRADFVRNDKSAPWSPASRLQGISFDESTRSLATVAPELQVSRQAIAIDRLFRILAPLLEEQELQFLILMNEWDLSLPFDPAASFKYQFSARSERRGVRGQGNFTISELMDRLPEAGMFSPTAKDRVALSDVGRQFATWLSANEYRSEYCASPLGSWGDKPIDWPDDRENPW